MEREEPGLNWELLSGVDAIAIWCLKIVQISKGLDEMQNIPGIRKKKQKQQQQRERKGTCEV